MEYNSSLAAATGGTVTISWPPMTGLGTGTASRSYTRNDSAATSASSAVTAENGNMYTVMMSDDGTFTAEFVQQPAIAFPLGTSGSTVEVRRNEDLTFSAMIDGEWMVITADTTVTAANGNVYAAQLSPEGVPIGVMHVAAMQEVMLGALGGTVTLTQAEDMTWWLGEAEVKDGYVHTAANGNMYALMMDSEGMWSAMYQQVMVTVALGTQGSIELVRAEDMSWWLGSAAVDVGSEVMSDNGNTYTLWYTDGAWTARFEPASMEIMGTGGLMVYSREADDMYDVESVGSGMTLDASGAGEITTSAGAMYRVMMMDGMLSGVRFDGAPKGDTVHITVGLYDSDLSRDAQVSYIADDRDTVFNEANTMVTIVGEKISLGDLLGDGMASKAATASDGLSGEFVDSAVEVLIDLRTEAELYAKYQAEATDDVGRSAFDARLNNIAERAQDAVDMIFGTNTPDSTATPPNNDPVASKVNIITDGTLPIEDTDPNTAGYQLSATDYIRAVQTVRGLNRLLDALSSSDAFLAATMKGNNGVFEDALGEDAAMKAYSANKSEYMVYFGTTENTRYGAIALKERVSDDFTPTGGEVQVEAAAVHKTRFQYDGTPTDDTTATPPIVNDVEVGRVGAFSYATVNDTLRARNLLQTGGAVYTGGTVAATPAGTLYSGDMRIDVNFRQQSVFGRVSDLMDKDNNLWKYLDSDVDTIYLPRQNYNNLTQFGGTGNEDAKRGGTGAFKTATIVYSQSQGFSTTPAEQPTNARFAGRFIGKDGAEITGTWSLGQPVEGETPARSNNLDVIFGSYGVTRQDSGGPVGPADGTAGGRFKTTSVLNGFVPAAQTDVVDATFAGDEDTAGILRLGKRSTGGGADTNNDFALTTIFANPGANPKKTVNNSPTHVNVVVDHINAQRAIYVIYAEQVGGDSDSVTDLANVGRQNAWKSINDFVRDHIFDVDAIAPTDTNADGTIQTTEVTELNDLSSPLGTFYYPMTRNGRPDDDAALERIDTLLAAFADKFAFADAVKDDGGGVFDSQPALDTITPAPDLTTAAGWANDPFPLNDAFDTAGGAGGAPDSIYDGDEPTGDIFGRISSQTTLFSLSTAYTRFGVWSRRETDSAVHDWANHATPFTEDPSTQTDGRDADGSEDDGATSPGSYAYSYLSQSTYRVDRPVATYPSNGLATYEGKTLVNTLHTAAYVGDALIRVNWSPLDANGAATSTIVPIFSNFERWDNSTLDRLTHGGKIVDEIAFRASGGAALVLTHDEEKLGITVADASVEVVYTDGTSIAAADAITGSTFNGKFVGSSGDGPLGILGTWAIPNFHAENAADGVATTLAPMRRGLTGSFGADLTSFETALP